MQAYSFQKRMNVFSKIAQPYRCALGIFLSILVVSFISGCASPSISKETQVNANEGILLTKVHSNLAGIRISVYDEGGTFMPKINIADDEYFKIEMFGLMAGTANQPVDYLRAVSVGGGKSYFGYMHRLNESVRLEPQYFNIVPGAINYVGDININWTSSGWGGYVQMEFVDAEEKTVREAKEKFPWLFDRYGYVKNLPEVKIETVPGFHEVKELKELKEKEKDSKDNAEETDSK